MDFFGFTYFCISEFAGLLHLAVFKYIYIYIYMFIYQLEVMFALSLNRNQFQRIYYAYIKKCISSNQFAAL